MENKLRKVGIAKLSESKKVIVFKFEGDRSICFVEDLFELIAGHRLSINLYSNYRVGDQEKSGVLSVQSSLSAAKNV